MLTEGLIKEKLVDLEKEYVDFIVEHFADWEVWAEASQRMADGKEGELPVRPSDRDGKSLISNTVRNRFGLKGAGCLAGPIQSFPIHWMKPLKTPDNDGIDAKIVLFKVAVAPRV